jgi:hypothetical protein
MYINFDHIAMVCIGSFRFQKMILLGWVANTEDVCFSLWRSCANNRILWAADMTTTLCRKRLLRSWYRVRVLGITFYNSWPHGDRISCHGGPSRNLRTLVLIALLRLSISNVLDVLSAGFVCIEVLVSGERPMCDNPFREGHENYQ